jgi:hypothetical protein
VPRNTSGLRKGGPGRPKGSKDRVPRSFKASLFSVFDRLETERPDLFEAAVIAGLEAKPPASFQYLQLWAHYREGKPTEKVEHSGDMRLEVKWQE